MRADLFGFFGTDLGQFTSVEPIAAAPWAFIEFDPAFGTKVMSMQFHARTTRAFPFASGVDNDPFVTTDAKQWCARCLVVLIHTLQLKRIKPDAAAAILANIYHQIPYLHPR